MRDLPAAPQPADLPAAGPIPEATVRTRVSVPLRFGDFTVTADVVTFHGLVDGSEHLALVLGDGADGTAGPPLVRLHCECLTGDVFGSARCDCGPQLREAVEASRSTAASCSTCARRAAASASTTSLTRTRCRTTAWTPTRRTWRSAAGGRARLHRRRPDARRPRHRPLDLLSNNPDKAEQLTALGLTVGARVPTGVFTTAHNVRYLHAKAVQTRHTLPLAELRERPAG